MRIPPITVIAQWPTPDYADPVTHGPAILIVNVMFIVLVLVAFVGRFYSRIVIKKWLGIDDFMCVLALVSLQSNFQLMFCAILTVHSGLHNRNNRCGRTRERTLWLESPHLGSA
jgi:hypothetical protein